MVTDPLPPPPPMMVVVRVAMVHSDQLVHMVTSESIRLPRLWVVIVTFTSSATDIGIGSTTTHP